MVKVLFVCLGNICRSPMAKAVFTHLVEERGLSDKIYIDAAGTIGYHAGSAPDTRTLQTIRKYNIELKHKARQVEKEDFYIFDYIIAMDRSNLRDLKALQPVDNKAEIHLMRRWDVIEPNGDVPDPYYGGIDGFDKNFEMLQRSAENLLEELVKKV